MVNFMKADNDNPLGKKVQYADSYDASLLFPIPRNKGRSNIFSQEAIESGELSFKGGYDIWNCYEVSWLSSAGKPEVRIIVFAVPYTSPNLVESKSLKLYLNSFNNTKFKDEQQVLDTIKKDMSEAAGTEIEVQIYKMDDSFYQKVRLPEGKLLDGLDVTLDNYDMGSEMLALDSSDEVVSEKLYSDLMRSNCLVTGQPDWGTVEISYEGKKIDHHSLLKYIISFRNHIEFHEQCVERIFNDIMKKCSPTNLTVYARYTRRGGIDINPMRSTHTINLAGIDNTRLVRQ